MLNDVDAYFLQHNEPLKSYLQYLRDFILKHDPDISEAWKYRMPFYCYKGKRFCYLWVHREYKKPYIGFVEGKLLNHPALQHEKRKRMKILLLDAGADVPVVMIKQLLQEAISFTRK